MNETSREAPPYIEPHSCETSQHLYGLPADSHWMAGESIVSKREAPLGLMVTLWFAALG